MVIREPSAMSIRAATMVFIPMSLSAKRDIIHRSRRKRRRGLDKADSFIVSPIRFKDWILRPQLARMRNLQWKPGPIVVPAALEAAARLLLKERMERTKLSLWVWIRARHRIINSMFVAPMGQFTRLTLPYRRLTSPGITW